MVSIIVPVYNGELYIQKCLDSILANTYKDFEIIIVENGSTDGTLDICRAYEARYSCIRVIYTDIKGLSHARNMGTDVASGEYISYVDADDYVSPYMLETLAEIALQYDSDFVAGSLMMGSDKDYRFEKSPYTTQAITLDDYYYNLFLRAQYDYSVSFCKLIKRSCIGNERFDETLTYFEDRECITRIVSHATNIVITNARLYYYWRGNENSISVSVDQKKRMSQVYALQKGQAYMDTVHPNQKLWQEYISCCLLQNADFRLRRAKQDSLTDLITELKSISKEAYKRVKSATHIPVKIKYRFLLEHSFPHLFAVAARIKNK